MLYKNRTFQILPLIDETLESIQKTLGWPRTRYRQQMFHKRNIHRTAYAHLVNAGNAPHMQRKLPIDDLVNIRKSQSKALGNLWEEKTYGSAALNRDMKNKMGFRIECDNPTGRRRLSDQGYVRSISTSHETM